MPPRAATRRIPEMTGSLPLKRFLATKIYGSADPGIFSTIDEAGAFLRSLAFAQSDVFETVTAAGHHCFRIRNGAECVDVRLMFPVPGTERCYFGALEPYPW